MHRLRLLRRDEMSPAPNSIYLFRKSVPARFAPTGTPLVISMLLHSSFAFLLFNLPQAFSARADLRSASAAPMKIYYFVPVLDTSRTLPHVMRSPVAPVQPASQKDRRSARNDQDTQANLAIISRPRQPDNTHQTILQPAAPDIRITVDLPLPDVIMRRKQGESPEMPVDLANAKPVERRVNHIDEAVPSIASAASPSLQSSLLPVVPAKVPAPAISIAKPTLARPRIQNVDLPAIAVPSVGSTSAPDAPAQVPLPVPSVSVAKPVQARLVSLAPSSAPTIQAAPAPDAPSSDVAASQPHLAFPSFSVAKPAQITRTAGVPDGVPAPVNQNELVIVGVNPSPAVSQIILPPGTRVGDFVFAPPTPGQSSASTAAKNVTDSQAAQKSVSPASSDKSAADTLVVGNLTSDKPETSGALGPALPPDTVFPVHWESPLRKSQVIVATGSIGGGGLGVYGVLNCGKIYTVFLPMPGKNWTMQYCDASPSSTPPPAKSNSLAIHWGDVILPPEPESKFDFRRLSVPADKRDKTIVLKGMLGPDGAVTGLQVYRGVTPEMNEAARLAFSGWKFKPAIRHGVPVPVQLLVGIPATTN